VIPFPIPWKLVGVLAVVVVICGLLWKDHYNVKRLNAARVELKQTKADYEALKTAQAHERKIATEATNEFQRTVKELQAAKADTPVRSVRLCRSPTGYVPASAPAPSGVDAGSANGLQDAAGFHPGYGNADRFGDAGPDIGPSLYAEADRANEVAAQCNALMGWIKAR
jgi:hypothetical protein